MVEIAQDFLDGRIQAICDLFPEGAEFTKSADLDGQHVEISWPRPLHGRPNRRSRPIDLHFEREAVDDLNEHKRQATDARFRALIAAKLSAFDDAHTAAVGVDPPAEEWLVTTAQLNYSL